MKPPENIEKFIKNIDIDTNTKVDEAVLDDVLKAFEKSKKPALSRVEGTKSATYQPNIWRIIMKSKITKLATVTVIIIAVMIVIHWFDSPIDIVKPAYGITDLPELIKNAKTMHMKGWFYSSQAEHESGEPVKSEFDYWFDIENTL